MGEVAGGDRILLLLMDAVIYAHVTPGMQKEAALRFEGALQQVGDGKQLSHIFTTVG